MKVQSRSAGINSAAEAITLQFESKEEMVGLINAIHALPDDALKVVIGEDTLISDPDKAEPITEDPEKTEA